ncbi:MAG: tetratricopeptide repeat protein, partial [Candidatus Krumholzibacteria bacterium]|nr:tetratricopeptide repeat protein [Candidatus Krumholzibacteria bacterium]
GSPLALDRLRALLQAEDQPNMAKATGLSLMNRYAAAADVAEVVTALQDEDPLIRAAAVDALATSPAERRYTLSKPLLEDPVRRVRLAAARNLAHLPRAEVQSGWGQDVAKARAMYMDYLDVNLERAETHLDMAMVFIASDSLARAEAAFAKALELGPRFAPGYVNYADFLRRSQRQAEAETILRQGIRLATEGAACHHALGLLLVGQGDLPAAIEQLGLAVAQRPGDARFGYVYAVALHSGGNLPASLEALEAVMEQNPWDVASLQALVMYSLEAGQAQRGLPGSERLLALNPGNAEARQMHEKMKKAAGR